MKIFIGILKYNRQKREIFKSSDDPTLSSHGDKYYYVVGPFKTEKGAQFMLENFNDPCLITPNDAERRVNNLEHEDNYSDVSKSYFFPQYSLLK